MKTQIAYFISSHGFGHAARSAAIMESMQSINSNIEFNIFSQVPEWFFSNSDSFNFNFYNIPTDVGLVQKTALREDINETINRLNNYLPLRDILIINASKIIKELDSRLVISDISPLGLAAARAAGAKSMLVENFTWDWIYEKYNLNDKNLNSHIEYLRNIYSIADFRIKAQPVCHQSKSDITTYPVSRKSKLPKVKIRNKLKLDQSKPLVIITMRGINTRYKYVDNLNKLGGINFIIAGISDRFATVDNIILIPRNSNFYHPDIVNACDAVIGKLGYSTLAEVYNAGKAFGFITRDEFPESVPLENYVKTNMNGLKITSNQFESNSWIDKVEELLCLKCISHNHAYGTDQAADFLNNLII